MNTAIPDGRKTLLLCEGGWDVAFFKAMAGHMSLGGEMFSFPIGGRDEFRPGKINAFVRDPRFHEIRAFGVVLDADHCGDDSAKRTLAKINEALRVCFDADANFLGHGEVKPLKSKGISVGAFVMPDGRVSGDLEDLLLKSARENHADIMKCVDAFRVCARPDAAGAGKESKKTVQTLFSGLPKYCPDLSVAMREKVINLDSDAFAELRDFLQKLTAA